MGRKLLSVDFDGTISKYEKGQYPKIGEPMHGVKETLQKLKDAGWTIIIYSVRTSDSGMKEKMKAWFEEHEIPYDKFAEEPKLDADWFVDDKGIGFTSWDDVLDKVTEQEIVS